MIQSMTGFGRGEAANDNYKITIEMKSVNHRYLDLSIRMPRKLNVFEAMIRSEVKKMAARGKIDIYVNMEELSIGSSAIRYNPQAASAYLQGLRQIAKDFQLEERIDALSLSRFPDVFSMEDETPDEDILLDLIQVALARAGEKFTDSRIKEGEPLGKDLLRKLDHISALVEKIEKRSPQIVTEYRQKITEKVNELLGNTQIDETVLASELVIFSDKICVDEEIVRLRTHVQHIKDTLQDGKNIGRKLDFLIQEMNREANTVLSKSNDVEVSDCGIELKTEIEKIREQIQNIE